jgi:hypothetical protein
VEIYAVGALGVKRRRDVVPSASLSAEDELTSKIHITTIERYSTTCDSGR